MRPEIQSAFLSYAELRAPREACALLVNVGGRERLHICKNLAESADHFMIDPRDYAAAEDRGDILAVIHSHPSGSCQPSQADLVGCETSGLPWHILSLVSGLWITIEPKGYVAPLVGRQYVYGTLDCFSIIRDWYRQERGIELPDFPRPPGGAEITEDLYVQNFERYGFHEIDEDEDLQVGDVVLMKIRSLIVNHAAIYVGDGKLLHHPTNRLSCREPLGGFWSQYRSSVVRHGRKP
jgi:proteasome lid subunit RPN8/RPN11